VLLCDVLKECLGGNCMHDVTLRSCDLFHSWRVYNVVILCDTLWLFLYYAFGCLCLILCFLYSMFPYIVESCRTSVRVQGALT
jgi:hypothetical protein